MTKPDLINFLNQNVHAVISTCGSSGQPEAALIGFGETDAFEIIFGTLNTSRKYTNIQENNKVSFVTGWEVNTFISIQYEGTARELQPSELEKYLTLYHAKVPSAAHYQSDPQQRYFLVTPTWIRYTDASSDEEKVVEFTF
jgi:uncharacterized pyridoxamine 5'-phosphate oxidase family protein